MKEGEHAGLHAIEPGLDSQAGNCHRCRDKNYHHEKDCLVDITGTVMPAQRGNEIKQREMKYKDVYPIFEDDIQDKVGFSVTVV